MYYLLTPQWWLGLGMRLGEDLPAYCFLKIIYFIQNRHLTFPVTFGLAPDIYV